jgi:thiol-disulfide isomerase/thioredoxin
LPLQTIQETEMNRREVMAAVAVTGLSLWGGAALAAGLTPYTAEAFKTALAAGPVVVHVHADWCPVCRKQQPTLQSMSSEPAMAKVKFISVNFDRDKEFLKARKIANQSVIVVFKDGKETVRIAGVTDPKEIRQRIEMGL